LDGVRPFQGKAPDKAHRPDHNERLEQLLFVFKDDLSPANLFAPVQCIVLLVIKY
jgi:hypothetical protein